MERMLWVDFGAIVNGTLTMASPMSCGSIRWPRKEYSNPWGGDRSFLRIVPAFSPPVFRLWQSSI